MTNLVLVRHGETVWHAENCYAGSADVELSPFGLAQAAELAAWAESAGLSEVWTSTLGRARRTAEPCAASSGAGLHIDGRLRELDFGAGEGLTRAEMEQRFPDALAAFLADPVAGHLPDGEDPVNAARRFVDCLRDIADVDGEGRVLIVTHNTVMRLALCELIGIPLRDYRWRFPSIRNCGLTEIRMRDGQAALLQFNAPVGPQK